MKSRSILVVDDDVLLRRVIETGLRGQGHNVIGTAGREEVLALLQSKQFDLVITDVLMPDIEGTEVIKAVKTHQPDAMVLAMSGGDTMRRFVQRRVRVPNSIRSSSRARLAPTQKWVPCPKARCGFGWRRMSNRNGSSNTASSRFADG